MTLLVWRSPSDSGTDCRCRKVPDHAEAQRLAVHMAEVFGACEVVHGSHVDLVLNHRATRHDAPVRDPEVLREILQEGV